MGPEECEDAAKPGSCWPAARDWSVMRLQLLEVHVAALLGLQLEAAGVAQALDGRRPKTLTTALLDLLAVAAGASGDHRVVTFAAVRSSNGFRTTNIVPKLEPLVVIRNDFPETPTVWATPGTLLGDLVDLLARTASVRCTEAESGNWTLTSR